MPALIAALIPVTIHRTARPVASASVSAINTRCREVARSQRLPINDISEEEHRLAKLWEDSLGATLDACCAGWIEQPVSGFWLEIDTDAEIIQPYYTQPVIAAFELKNE